MVILGISLPQHSDQKAGGASWYTWVTPAQQKVAGVAYSNEGLLVKAFVFTVSRTVGEIFVIITKITVTLYSYVLFCGTVRY